LEQPSAVHDTFVLEREYPKAPERVFAAFADPAKKRRWSAEGPAHTIESFELDFRVGGSESLRYRFNEGTPFAGAVIDNRATFQDIVANRRIVLAQTMDFGPARISATLVTIELLKTQKGTKLICTHHGAYFEGADGPDIRKQGWRALFERLVPELER
jgi:uncharacterized protein YndB with AHSA1/START domain